MGLWRGDSQPPACSTEVPCVLHLSCVILFYPAVCLKTANPYSYYRTKFNISITDFIAPFLWSQHQLCDFFNPVVKHQLKLRSWQFVVVLLKLLQLLERAMSNELLCQHFVLLKATLIVHPCWYLPWASCTLWAAETPLPRIPEKMSLGRFPSDDMWKLIPCSTIHAPSVWYLLCMLISLRILDPFGLYRLRLFTFSQPSRRILSSFVSGIYPCAPFCHCSMSSWTISSSVVRSACTRSTDSRNPSFSVTHESTSPFSRSRSYLFFRWS